MTKLATDCAHIELRDGVPYIAGTMSKVRNVITNHLSFDLDGRELQEQLPHLTLGQVYAALGYYYDHKDEMDADFEEGDRMEAELRPLLEDPVQRAKLIERIAAFREARRDPE